MADRGGARVRLLAFFTLIGAAATAGLYFVAQGDWVGAALVYSLAGIGFWGGVIFNDALLVDVADPPQYDLVSALRVFARLRGRGTPAAAQRGDGHEPGAFGLADAAQAVRIAFLMVAAWWILFTVPCLLWVREDKPARPLAPLAAARAGWRELRAHDRGSAQVPRRSSGSCSLTGSTSTASTRSSRWRWTSGSRSASRNRA